MNPKSSRIGSFHFSTLKKVSLGLASFSLFTLATMSEPVYVPKTIGLLYVVPDQGPFGGPFSQASAMNNHDDVVGSANGPDDPDVPAGYPTKALLYRAGAVTALPDLVGINSEALGINDAGIIVGASQSSRDP